MHNIVTVAFKDSNTATANGVRQWDYGQILRIQGLQLPTAVEVHFAIIDSKDSVTRIGTTKDGVTDVVIPDSMIEAGKNIFAYVYLRDSESGQTEYEIKIVVTTRAKPEAFDTPEDKELFAQAIEAVNEAADRAEKAGQAATEAAGQAAEDAQQTAEDRKEVAKMVETVTDISEQVKKVEDLSNKAQAAATKTEADAQRTAEDRAEVGKMLETVKDVSEQVKTVDESVRKAKESEQAAEGHRTAVEEMKNSVEQTASTFPQKVQEGVQAIENAGASEVQEITQAGTAQKTAVEGAGTQAVNSVENAQQTATEAVGEAKTTAVQAVQAEGAKQTGNVTTEGTKQVKAVQDKGNEVLQSIPEDFTTQMETKLNKQQGIENKGKALVIGEDGNVAPGEVQSGGGDGIAIINTMSGESPLVIPDSAERVNKRLELGGKTAQVQTTGAQLLNKDNFFVNPPTTFDKLKYYPLNIGDKECTLSTTCPASGNTSNLFLLAGNIDKGASSSVNGVSFGISRTVKSQDGYVTIALRTIGDNPNNPLDYDIMLNYGSEAKPYEPYTGGKPSPSPEYPQEIKNVGKRNEETQKYEVDVKITNAEQNWSKEQTLTLTSDRPITKWDRLVEQDGQIGWLYQSNTVVIDGSETWSSSNVPDHIYFTTTVNNKSGRINTSLCKTYKNNGEPVFNKKHEGEYNIYSDHPTNGVSDTAFVPPSETVTTIPQWKEWLNANPIEMLYKTKTTEFIPLPQSEQNAIRALKTYYPTTVITADGGELDPDIKVTYTADTKNYIDNKVSAKVASIIRQYRLNTANLLSLMPTETQAAMIENDTNNILENAEEMKHE